jgi:sterol 3beta-glucosyltransferase
MAPGDEVRSDSIKGKGRVPRKLSKRPRDRKRMSLDIPEKFKDGDDANEDVTAPPPGNGGPYMNQSVFSMITAAGSTADFHSRFDDGGESSESEDGEKDAHSEVNKAAHQGAAKVVAEANKEDLGRSDSKKHRRKLSDTRMFRALPKLSLKTPKERQEAAEKKRVSSMSKSTILPPRAGSSSRMGGEGSAANKILAAQGQLNPSSLGKELAQHVEEEGEVDGTIEAGSDLPSRLKEIFNFADLEEVISGKSTSPLSTSHETTLTSMVEYPCWLLQSVLLQGYMYITSRHICFYAYLPKKSNVIAKSGHLSKRGRQNPRYNRYWFILKGDVLSYYTDPSDVYFPSGNIDLRYGVSASLTDNKVGTTGFSVVTQQRSFFFKADSAASAKEWVKQVQKVIFRSHNDGDSVKISLPIANVIDIEETSVLDFADTFKIRVVDSEETFAIDEVCIRLLKAQSMLIVW